MALIVTSVALLGAPGDSVYVVTQMSVYIEGASAFKNQGIWLGQLMKHEI